jgi:hypothetical protein
VFGKKTQKPIETKVGYVRPENIMAALERGTAFTYHGPSLKEIKDYKKDGGYIYAKFELDRKINTTACQIGCEVLDQSKIMMADFMKKVDDQRGSPLDERRFFNYGDTDSIRVPANEVTKQVIADAPRDSEYDPATGTWTKVAFSVEHGDLVEEINLGKKSYCITDKDDNVFMSCKGQNKSAITKDDFTNVAKRVCRVSSTRPSVKNFISSRDKDGLSFETLRRELAYTSLCSRVHEVREHCLVFGPTVHVDKMIVSGGGHDHNLYAVHHIDLV